MSENVAFTERLIAKLQRLSIADSLFCQAGQHYLIRQGRMLLQASTGLWWVVPPNGKVQVAVWMIPAVLEAERAS